MSADSSEDCSNRVVVVASMIPPAHSGAGYSALKYAQRLDREGQLAFLLTAAPQPAADWNLGDAELMDVIQKSTVHVGFGGTGRIKTGIRLLAENTIRCVRTFWTLFRTRRNFSIVHCFSPTWLSLFAGLAAKALRKKLIVEITLLGGDCPGSVTHNRARILHHRKMLQFRMADAIVCLSPALERVCLRSGIPAEKLAVIPRAVDTERFSPAGPEGKQQRRRELGLPEDLTLILFVGGILRRKGIDLLLPAFRKLAGLDSRIGLVIVGPAHKSDEGARWEQEIRGMERETSLAGRLFYPGWRMNVSEYMQAADLFVLPSRQEGFPNVLVEAMASGIPPVALAIDGITEAIIEDGETGYIVREADADVLAAGLLRAVVIERNAPGEAGRAARERVMEKFSGDRIDLAYRSLYSRIRRPADTIDGGLSKPKPVLGARQAERLEESK